MFYNVPPEIGTHGRSSENTLHPVIDPTASFNHTHLLLGAAAFFTLDALFIDFGQILVNLCCWSQSQSGSTSEVEYLPSYWEAISGYQSKIWYATEVYNRKNCSVQRLDDDSLEKLRTVRRENKNKTGQPGCSLKFIRDNYNYDILSNIYYNQFFCYSVMNDRNDQNDCEFSDFITFILNWNKYMSKPQDHEKAAQTNANKFLNDFDKLQNQLVH